MMPLFSHNRYKYNSETLSYQKINVNWRKRLRIISVIILSSIAFSGLVFFLIINHIDTPKEMLLIKQNEILSKKYKQLHGEIDQFQFRLDSLNHVDDDVYRAVFGEKPIAQEIRLAGVGGAGLKRSTDSLSYEALIQETNKKLKALNNQFKVSENSYHELLKLALNKKEKLKHLPAIMPVHNDNLERTGSGFGKRYHPILNIWRMHEGQDFNAPKGTKVFATGNARVKKVYVSKTFGNCVILDHGYGYETYYAHLQKFNVKKGKKVKRGDVIGFVGTTGLSSGVHLHYEVHLNGVEVDPLNYFYNDLTPEQYNMIIAIANSFTNSMD